MSNARLHVFYLVHDLSDAAIHKRAEMLRAGGAVITTAGFRRSDNRVDTIAGFPTVDLGRTYGGRFLQRIYATVCNVFSIKRYYESYKNVDIIVARNLEMLAIAVRARSLCANKPRLVYECLDIHRLMLDSGAIGQTLRRLEGWLAKRASALITSSPAFVKYYFDPVACFKLPVLLIENKVYNPKFTPSADVGPSLPDGPPWRIGWFGIIRCQKSFDILKNFVTDRKGEVEVIIRGIPALHLIPEFHSQIAATPGISYTGPYKNPDDLARIYSEVHFTWAIDMSEEGLNSTWLLPNRLYEGGLYNTVPIAQKSVETGRFLDQQRLGVTLESPLNESLQTFFNNLTPVQFRRYKDDAARMSLSYWLMGEEDCLSLVNSLRALQVLL